MCRVFRDAFGEHAQHHVVGRASVRTRYNYITRFRVCGCKTAAAAAAFDNIITTGVASTSPRSEWRGGREEAHTGRTCSIGIPEDLPRCLKTPVSSGPGRVALLGVRLARLPPKTSARLRAVLFSLFFFLGAARVGSADDPMGYLSRQVQKRQNCYLSRKFQTLRSLTVIRVYLGTCWASLKQKYS